MPAHKVVSAPTLDEVWRSLREDATLTVALHVNGPEALRTVKVQGVERFRDQVVVIGHDLPNRSFRLCYDWATGEVVGGYELKYRPLHQ